MSNEIPILYEFQNLGKDQHTVVTSDPIVKKALEAASLHEEMHEVKLIKKSDIFLFGDDKTMLFSIQVSVDKKRLSDEKRVNLLLGKMECFPFTIETCDDIDMNVFIVGYSEFPELEDGIEARAFSYIDMTRFIVAVKGTSRKNAVRNCRAFMKTLLYTAAKNRSIDELISKAMHSKTDDEIIVSLIGETLRFDYGDESITVPISRIKSCRKKRTATEESPEVLSSLPTSVTKTKGRKREAKKKKTCASQLPNDWERTFG